MALNYSVSAGSKLLLAVAISSNVFILPSRVYAQASSAGGVTSGAIQPASGRAPSITGAPKSRMRMLKALPVQPSSSSTPARSAGTPGAVGGSSPNQPGSGVSSQNFGNQRYAYTTALVRPVTLPKSTTIQNVATSSQPYLAAGKLWMRFGTSWFICSASMIGRGIVHTAAHCVSDFGGGQAGVSPEMYFIPAANSNAFGSFSTRGPIGAWRVDRWYIPGCYLAGTCKNTSAGVITSNDVAILRLAKNTAGQLPSNLGAGWYGYGWNGYGYTTGNTWINSSKLLGNVTTLGYPGAIGDSSTNLGGAMVRTDSASVYYVPGTDIKNHVWGTQQTGGSSGSPVLTNFGTAPVLGSVASPGLAPVRNVIVGSISWGFTDRTQQVQGSSWYGQNVEFPSSSYIDAATGKNYGAGNIAALVRAACGNAPTYGGGQTLGYCQ